MFLYVYLPICLCLHVWALAASLDHPAGETRIGDWENKTPTTRRRQEDTVGSVGRITVRGTCADIKQENLCKHIKIKSVCSSLFYFAQLSLVVSKSHCGAEQGVVDRAEQCVQTKQGKSLVLQRGCDLSFPSHVLPRGQMCLIEHSAKLETQLLGIETVPLWQWRSAFSSAPPSHWGSWVVH